MNIRKLKTAAFGLAALLLTASPALAQRGGMGMGMGPGLLSNSGVQQELKLDTKQTEEANKIAADFREKATAARESTSSLEGEERQKKMQELTREITVETMKSVRTLLNSDQLKRYNQIVFQQRGAMSFAIPEVQAEFKLSDDQKEKLKECATASQAKMREIFESAAGDRAAAMTKFTELRKETLEKALAILNDDQKKLWAEKTGAPYEVKFERPAN